MATLQSTNNRSRLAATARDRGARTDGVAARPGVWLHADVRGTAHERVGERARRRPGRCGLRRLVPRSLPARARSRRCPSFPRTFASRHERRVVERLPVAPDQVRAWLPVQTYPVSAGVKGGLAGSVAMAVLACAYGLLKAGSIWYPINLLAAVGLRAVGEARTRTAEFVSSRQLRDRRWCCTARLHARSGCSTARCCRCSRGGRSCSAG